MRLKMGEISDGPMGSVARNPWTAFPARIRNLERSAAWACMGLQTPSFRCSPTTLPLKLVVLVVFAAHRESLPRPSRGPAPARAPARALRRCSLPVSTSASHFHAPITGTGTCTCTPRHRKSDFSATVPYRATQLHWQQPFTDSLECFTAHHCRHQLARVISETRVHRGRLHEEECEIRETVTSWGCLLYKKSDQFAPRRRRLRHYHIAIPHAVLLLPLLNSRCQKLTTSCCPTGLCTSTL